MQSGSTQCSIKAFLMDVELPVPERSRREEREILGAATIIANLQPYSTRIREHSDDPVEQNDLVLGSSGKIHLPHLESS